MAIMIAALLTISMGSSIMLVQNTSAHTPAWSIATYSFMSVSPNPIGIGQQVNLNFWLNAPPPTAGTAYGDRWTNMTVVITHPDGTNETKGPFISDDTGGSHTVYTPTEIGNYTFQMKFAGEVLQGLNSANGQISTNAFVNDTFEPSVSNAFKLTVQQDPISGAFVNPNPANYWTRPIYGENNNWYAIGGNWLGLGVSTFANTGMYNASTNYNPYTTAPNSAHILWTKPVAFGGTIGGEAGGSEQSNYWSTSQYQPKFAPIIIQDVLYYTMYPGASNNPAGWAAVDLHTGQTLWVKNTTAILRCGQINNYLSPNQFGAIAYLWATGAVPGVVSSGTTYSMYDAMTGSYILSIVNSTALSQITEDERGNLIGYYINASTTNQWNSPTLVEWNSSRAILRGPTGTGDPNNWQWNPTLNQAINFSYGIEWAVPIASNISDVPISLSISAINSGVVMMTYASVAGSSYFQDGWIVGAGYSSTDGHYLWGPTNRSEVEDSRVLYGATTAGNNVWVEFDASLLTASGYSLSTGKQLWGPVALPNVSPFSDLGEQYVVANGTIYLWTYGGDVYSIDMTTGNINWQYHTPPGGYESPYGIEPLWTFTVGTVADGKLFVPEGHMYSPPLFHQAQQLALNLTDGTVVWSIDAFDVTSAPAIVDGVMTTLNAYDNQIYTWGKGPSAITVSAPDVGVTTQTPITIRGSVIDKSAGTQQQAQAANFPSGVPAVSDASQTAWMEYVYMQQPCPTNVTGVPVTISVIDSNGNQRQVGSAISDGSGMYSYTWTPDITGDYTVIASFAGSESYYSSAAETSFHANAPAATATPAPTAAPSMADQYFIPAVAGIFVVIVLVGLMIILVLRKRP
jgi:hypothetical protein